ncbi:MAG: rhodanese-like domain-containing protein [Gammaproteobacteria bacterium]|nr:rhodanese-like domain-containing protein [Gammaproteobacteria bacterium]
MSKLLTLIFSVSLLCFSANVIADDKLEQFPKRVFYPQLDYIDTQELAIGLKENKFDVIDVRDATSFKALHVKSATNIFVKSESFEKEILDFVAKSNKPLVVYCNGISCSKSYIASSKMKEIFANNKITKTVRTYDSGINAIAYAHNDMVLKNGKDVSKDNPLIAMDKIKKHTLSPAEFENYIAENNADDYAILDIRERNERIIFKIFMFQNEKKIALNKKEKMIAFLNKVKQDNKTLMVYDVAGRQIFGLYELLKITGIKKWHYLEGGEFGYSKYSLRAAGL